MDNKRILPVISSNVLNRFNGQKEKDRVKKAQKLHDFYHVNYDAIIKLISETMRNSSEEVLYIPAKQTGHYRRVSGAGLGLFGEKTLRIMPRVHFKVFNKVVSLICTLYDYGIDRYLVDPKTGEVDETATDYLLELYEKAGVHEKQQEIYEQAFAFNTIHVQPVWRDGKVEIDVYSPHVLHVDPSPINKYKAEKIYIEQYRYNDKGVEEQIFVVWSDKEHYILNSSGQKVSVKAGDKENSSNQNPYEKIPLIKFSLHDGDDYFGEGRLELVDQTIWFNIGKANSLFLSFYKFGFGYGYNLGETGNLQPSPNSFIMVDGVKKDDKEPKMEMVKNDMDLSQIDNTLQDFYKLVGNSNGVNGANYDGTPQQMSAESKFMDSKEMETTRRKHKSRAVTYETEFYQMFKAVHNKNVKDLKDGKGKLRDDLIFVCEFIEPRPSLSPTDEIAVWEYEIKTNMSSYIDYMIAKNPNLTSKRALKNLKKNFQINDEIRKLVHEEDKKNDTGKPGNENPDDGNKDNGDGNDGATAQ